MRKLFKIVTSRLIWSALLILIEFFLMVYLVFWAAYARGYYIYFYLLSILVTVFVLTRKESPSYKVVWIALASVFPTLGGVLYLLFGNKKIGQRAERRLEDYINSHLTLSKDVREMEDSRKKLSSDVDVRMANYIYNMTGLPAYDNTEAYYFATGEEFFSDVFSEMEKAKKYIFIEYFIIGLGEVWSKTLELLKRKAKEGVDVRLMYDDMGSINSVPIHYEKTLRNYGIKAVVFNPVKPHMNPRLNFRDHRKILSIDGEVCYTGGLNLADEYANRQIRFGYWKDNAVKFRGAAVWNFTYLFLEMWAVLWGGDDDLKAYVPTVSAEHDGFVQPFGDNPLDDVSTAEDVYVQMISSAKRYVWITTPYLIPDDQMIGALTIAAAAGVDVRIITPRHPDKKTIFEVSRSNYAALIKAGVKIYEYIPGFIHAKTFIADDAAAVVGTTNIDYRSFYLHFEISVLFLYSSVVKAVKDDFEKTLLQSEEMTPEMVRAKGFQRIVRGFLRLFSPAF